LRRAIADLHGTLKQKRCGTEDTVDEQLKHYSSKLAYEIDPWDLKVALEDGERITIVDARSPQAFASEHIPGALSLPHRTMNEATTAKLDKAALVVTYCDGIGCNASTKGALQMTRLGFRVKELIGGLDWWKRDGHPTEGSAVATVTSSGCGCG
jgi:rhodanese-related sulfurtransferase